MRLGLTMPQSNNLGSYTCQHCGQQHASDDTEYWCKLTPSGADKEKKVRDLKHRLKLARQRVAYWSGRPSFTGYGHSTRKSTSGISDMEYERAMSDVNNLADQIQALTGKRPATTDYRAEFQKAYLRLSLTTKPV